MSNAATWNEEVSGRVATEHKVATSRLMLFWALVFFLATGLGGWVYLYSKAALHQRAVQVESRWGVGGAEISDGLLRQIDQLAVRLSVIVLAGGVASLVAFSM